MHEKGKPAGEGPASIMEAFYGPGVSAVLPEGDAPQEPQSFFVQYQTATADDVSPWMTMAVYGTAADAELFVARLEAARPERGTVELSSGEFEPEDEQPVLLYRVATLWDLIQEGSEAVARMARDLAGSDHDWRISTELGLSQKRALLRGEADQ